MKKITFGVLSTAKIGTEKVIPAMQQGKFTEISAIASRNEDKAKQTAQNLNIPKFYRSYEALLDDPDIDAVYIPLPNHMHVEWSIKALKAGKHVLCEKPIGLSTQEAEHLACEAKKFPKLKLMEAFMYRHHPQNTKIKALLENGVIGDLKSVHATFSYYNVDPNNIRNIAEIGGGGLLDIGCYCISISRFMFGEEPTEVCASMEFDAEMKTDILTSGTLRFPGGMATITCATQLAANNQAFLLGTTGKMLMHCPFVPGPNDTPKVTLHTGDDIEELSFGPVDHYTIQGDLFAGAILNETPVPTPFEDALANMRVIDAIAESAQTGRWVKVG